MTRKFLLALLILAMSFNLACAAEVQNEGEKAPEQPKILARVDGIDITEAEVLQFLQGMGAQAMMFYGTEQGQKMILDEIISLRLFALDAAAKKLDETEEFKTSLENIRRSLLANADVREIVKDVKVTEDNAKKFYDEHLNEYFKKPEQIRASHILISDDVNSVDIIADIQGALSNGVSFDELAEEFSLDPGSAANGGDLGEFPRGVMVKEFEEAAFNLQNVGDISEPVKTQFGWHIIKLDEKIPESTIKFDDVKEQIIHNLQDAKSSELLKKHSDELEKVYKVERF